MGLVARMIDRLWPVRPLQNGKYKCTNNDEVVGKALLYIVETGLIGADSY